MPYKIVQTVEKGETILVVVPSLWENNGILFWPPKKILQRVIKDDKSIPNFKGWSKMNCYLKRSNLTYQQADTEITIMEQNSDTDCQNECQAEDVMTASPHEEVNYDLMADNLVNNQENLGTANTDTTSCTTTGNLLTLYNAQPFNSDQVLSNQKILSDKLDAMFELLTTNNETQIKITQSLASLSVQVDELYERVTGLMGDKAIPTTVTLLKNANPKDNESFSIQPINSELQLKTFESNLKDKSQRLKLKDQLSFLCTSSTGAGITCAYKLLDILFTREFLCECSWSGGSKTKAKVGLKYYTNLLHFFFTMIHTWDSTYTIQENEKFFKTVTKNSVQRQAMKNLRMSSVRRRKTEGTPTEGPVNKKDKKERGNESEEENTQNCALQATNMLC